MRIVVHNRPLEAFVRVAFAAEFTNRYKRPVEYQGESIAVFASKVFHELCRLPIARRKLTEGQHEITWEPQRCACNLCGSPATQTPIDHVAPRFVGGAEGFANPQILCSKRRSSKTMLEKLSLVEDGQITSAALVWRRTRHSSNQPSRRSW